MRTLPVLCVWLLGGSVLTAAEPAPVEKGTVRYKPLDDQKAIPACYRLDARTFDYEMKLKFDMPANEVSVHRLTFPSPVETTDKENNTVHAEYYRPMGKGPFPAVIVLDITAGDGSVSRAIATHLAQHKIAGLFVHMAYYGPRRPPGSKMRLMSPDIPQTVSNVRQTVLDLRLATAWLELRPEVDGKRLGILGTSLGSFIAGLTAEMEPKLGRVALLLSGGGFVDYWYDVPQAAAFRFVYELLGGSKEKMAAAIAPIDPLTCAANLKQRKVLQIAGKRDELVPPKMAEALWKACGEQRIVWYDCTHYGAVAYLVSGMENVVKHFQSEEK
jgi:dienelactone hydrolase